MKPHPTFGATGVQQKKVILLFGHGDMAKAHVKGYARSDGTYVQEHQDRRQAAQPKPKADGAAKKSPDDLGALAEHHESMSNRHYKLAKIKGAKHPDHDVHLDASRLHAQAQYHLEQAKGAENEDDRSRHMEFYNHTKGKIKDAESDIGDEHWRHAHGHGL